MVRLIWSTMVLAIMGISALAQQRPLLTEDIDITPPGTINIAAGTDFFQNAKFPVSGLKGDLTRVGDIRVRTGYASNVELQIEGVIQEFLAIDSTSASAIPLNVSGNSTNDFSDIKTTVKIKLKNESKNFPAVGFSVGFEMPNSNQSRGIGLNQTNVFSKVILQKNFGKEPGKDPRVKAFGNVGLGIYSAPLASFGQNDMILYGLAGIVRVNDHVNIASEVNGRLNTRGAAPLGTESRGQFRIGTQIKASGLRFDTAAIVGLTRYSPRSGITFGVTYQSPKLFTPAQ